jgi:hypothetical protein
MVVVSYVPFTPLRVCSVGGRVVGRYLTGCISALALIGATLTGGATASAEEEQAAAAGTGDLLRRQ